MTLQEIRQEFNKIYSNLSIDFYAPSKNSLKDSPGKLDYTVPLKEICHISNVQLVNIDAHTTVNELKVKFMEACGLLISMSRKSANVWVDTKFTGNWTLSDQNFEGKQVTLD
ncbi:MAG: hypothetical protein ABI151_13550 [Chitinophagaceae bacterium]